ncbi:acylphosphatase [Propionigenium maris DSM 9537]|uniref:Acylphosphatase n=1 Tax=Propionigenium maris DSM 9537 TaxID=1123000 RepID=A0A9W6GJ45_9FUSO|nr:acylphosphatase [Propionigenium maris]GLI54612.1 acylphosphatase [Propionigenium maris DSM 9537]
MHTHNWIVTGRVQGVGFRYFTYSIANKYGLRGWVRNLSDGSVEVMIQGEEGRIENLRKYLLRGNMFIKVGKIQEKTLEVEEFSSFEIRY